MGRGKTGTFGEKPTGPDKWGPEMQDAFCDELAKHGVIIGACDAVGISYCWMNQTRKKDSDFDDKVKESLKRYHLALRKAAHQRAVDGIVERPIVDGEGNIIGEVRKFSDSLLLALLKRTDEGFKERVSLDGKVKTDSTVNQLPIDLACLTKKERTSFVKIVAKLKAHAEELAREQAQQDE